MQQPGAVHVLDLFAEERQALLALLAGLTDEEWGRPTACAGWSVRDVAVHLLGGDLTNLSRRRDGYNVPLPAPGEPIVTFINRVNEQWVGAARRLSPRLLIDLLGFAGPPLFTYFASLDLSALGGPVSWAGPGPAPVWLDVAREYTERWHHQQHIRDAVGKPGLTHRRFMWPVLATFVHALPVAYRDVDAADGTAVQLHIDGEAGGAWSVVREAGRWVLYEGVPSSAAARVSLDQSVAWRLFTKGITTREARPRASIEGDPALGERLLHTVAIIA